MPPAQLLAVKAKFAVEPPGSLSLPLFEPKALKTSDIVGKAAEFALDKNDPFYVFGLPRKMLLEFRLMTKPTTVVRGVTKESIELLQSAKDKSSLDTRVVFTGRAGCGKSFLLLQAVEHCVAQKWVVIYIPRAVNLVNSTTTHAYDIRTQTYLQPTFSFQTLQRMLTVNDVALRKLTLQTSLQLEKREVPAGTSLAELIEIAINDRSRSVAQAPLILETVMRALEEQTRYPVLFAVDDFQSLYGKSKYRDPHFETIHSYHLSLPRMMLEYASGRRKFNKGAFVGAISCSDTNFPLPIELRDALGLEYDHPMSPYDKRFKPVFDYTEGLKAIKVPEKLSVQEAMSVFEIWKNEQALADVVMRDSEGRVVTNYDEQFLAKYTQSGGNARDFVWGGILANMEA
ncbi:mitochondrial ribosomal death-associated protein 3-domain-containing protein [Crassisporium funariophilum]|nr:mitochondrial ribosomal death-associated protein 3-domain-containing protein [Crassisporium funariophilum]